jgi:hypothetical protein
MVILLRMVTAENMLCLSPEDLRLSYTTMWLLPKFANIFFQIKMGKEKENRSTMHLIFFFSLTIIQKRKMSLP